MRGTPDSRPLDAFEAGEGDYIIPKRRYDAFFGTDLDITLRELGRDTLVVVGFDTNICVLHTLAGAYFLGYRTIVPADATATLLIGTQEGGLEYFSSHQILAWASQISARPLYSMLLPANFLKSSIGVRGNVTWG